MIDAISNVRLGSLASAYTLILVLSPIGCVDTDSGHYEGWSISTEVKESARSFRNYRSGHLVVRSDKSVLSIMVARDYTPYLVTDDETCERTLVEIPTLDTSELPYDVDNPRAYLQTCNCAWGHCIEEPLSGGHLRVSRIVGKDLFATADLQFPSRTVVYGGQFRARTPELTDLFDDADVEAIKNQRSQ